MAITIAIKYIKKVLVESINVVILYINIVDKLRNMVFST